MKFILFSIMLLIGLNTQVFAEETISQEQSAASQALPAADIAKPYVTLKTNMGDMVFELEPEKAPITVANFLNYASEGFYDGLIFHRVIKDFMIQTGGFTANMIRKAPKAEIKNEADNGLFNNRGTLAMARTAKVNSATSQFFINVKNNYFLNNGYRDFGYAVFGKVIYGLEVMDAISQVETGRKNGMKDVPVEPIIIQSTLISYEMPDPATLKSIPSEPEDTAEKSS